MVRAGVVFWFGVSLLFCALGKWQLERYHFKRDLLSEAAERLAGPPVPFARIQSGNLDPVAFQTVRLSGRYMNDQTVLIQNRFHDHRLGVEVLTPFEVPGDRRWVMVDRGWVGLDEMNLLPEIPPVPDWQSVTGHLKLLDESQFILGPNILHPDARPLVVQKVDMKEISTVLKADFYPFIVRLDPLEAHGYVRDWSEASLVAIPPERHLGYAIQWFVMAGVLLLASVIFARKTRVSGGQK